MESLASDSPWNPGSRAFWSSEPEKKVKLLLVVAIIGLILAALNFMAYFWSYFSLEAILITSKVPLFHCLILFWVVKKKSRPSNVFRAVLGLLLIGSIIKMFLAILWYWAWYGNTIILGTSLLHIWITGITFLLWKHVGDREFHGPNPNALMIFVFVTLILGTYQTITQLNFWMVYVMGESSFNLLRISDILSFLLFWGAFTLLHIYRTEIEPWEDASTSYDLESHQTRHGISAFNASKLKEAKELLDNRVISEEEFQQIKDEYLQ